jgi:micrococcal nuclease
VSSEKLRMTYNKTTTALAVATICVIGILCVAGYYMVQAATSITIDENELYDVQEVKDGDTFTAMVGHHEITVRMLGIDTPETVDPRKPEQCYGKEASDQTKSLLSGKKVQLKLNPNREEKDRYGRYLAFVYSGEIFLNKFLLQEGYAREYTFGKPYMHQKEFRDIEKEAKKAEKGLWGVCTAPDYKLLKPL